ncbi:hypothetical protein CXG81DRAFT_11594 [Caulochytrium protostelioides]|uniref:E3 ubiquitin protein ligase n=1 Tax=Caulochytrium protostelioides TaxID=1555241 RepID=A0A4P9X8W0_9FUNG|nr:hypothetical protein CXG81DRAFT_11594 [Caulochytrium protostelioides]|eukprot:RKP01754.1 hypothetical protein CXG81DRAFT_11594 [Caulochytrium protostelioides]
MATQTSKLSAQLAERDERLHRLALDKAKLHQRNGVLTKQAGVATQLAAASKLAGERAAEHARVHMERERVLDEQARALRLQLDETAMLLDAARKRCAEGAAVRGEMDERVRVATARAEDAVAQLTARSAALEATAQALRDAQADLSAARAQLEQRERLGDGGAAAKQVEELRFLLLCSSCRKRFKSHCLARCMHVFCKDCIDDMYTSRQRKCPSCGLGFGQQDIRQVYL